jgi:GT2 family glycosyltransferase
MRAAVLALMTSHNRCKQTLAALEAVSHQRASSASVRVILVDAGSDDGTVEAVEARFPDVTVIRADPDVFWNQGMRIAQAHGRREDPDHYLWLNDDTVLDEGAIARLLATRSALDDGEGRPPIVVGTTRDPVSGEATYGGLRRTDRRRPLRFELVPPGVTPQPVETMHGNCVLVPRRAAHEVGCLEPAFTHAMGDLDFGLRARTAGFGVWIAPGTIGTCSRNSTTQRGPRAALRHLTSPKVIPPREWATFARRWGGPLWPIYFMGPYLRPWIERPWRRTASDDTPRAPRSGLR